MTLTLGDRLGPYEIQSSPGAGGMGEVYRASDTRLGRDVALKVLPAEMAHDAERLPLDRVIGQSGMPVEQIVETLKALAQANMPNYFHVPAI